MLDVEANLEEVENSHGEPCEWNMLLGTWWLMEGKSWLEQLDELNKLKATIDVEVLLDLWVGSDGVQESGKISHGWDRQMKWIKYKKRTYCIDSIEYNTIKIC
jgi:hypothetical protein